MVLRQTYRRKGETKRGGRWPLAATPALFGSGIGVCFKTVSNSFQTPLNSYQTQFKLVPTSQQIACQNHFNPSRTLPKCPIQACHMMSRCPYMFRDSCMVSHDLFVLMKLPLCFVFSDFERARRAKCRALFANCFSSTLSIVSTVSN